MFQMLEKRPVVAVATILGVALISSCATLPKDFDKRPSYAFTDTRDTHLGESFHDELKTHPGQSGVLLLGRGLDAFVARAVLARLAQRSIDVQYYLYHDDLVARLFTDFLLEAADRGVRVRLLVDDMGLEGRDLSAAVLETHPNIQVRIFNPFSRKAGRISQYINRIGSVTRRMHNKSFTVDNQVTVLGGRNIGNEYFEADPDLAFADLDVMVIGPVANEVSASFDRYWNSDLAYPATVLRGEAPTPEEIQQKQQQLKEFVARQGESEYLEALRNSSLSEKLRTDKVVFRWGTADVVYDQPEKLQHDFDQTQFHLSPQLEPYWKAVDQELIIFSPYFVPGRAGTAFLTQLAQRGVRVRILTNSLASNDVALVHAGYAKYRKDLLRAGVELYELNKRLTDRERKEKNGVGGSSKASLHAKSFVFDRQQVFIGSLNLDPRAVLHNTEIGVVINQAEVAGEMATWFDRNIARIAFRLELETGDNGTEAIVWHGVVDGMPETFRVEPYTGFWKRLGISFMRLLPIESQL